jgi:chromosome segregation ATPase
MRHPSRFVASITRSMEASHGSERRVIRLADASDAVELDTADLLGRLEAQAEETGRLQEKVASFERMARAERDARRRLAETIKRERKAAEALHARAERAEAALAAQAEEVERLQQAVEAPERQMQLHVTRMMEVEREQALKDRSLWRKLLQRPPQA